MEAPNEPVDVEVIVADEVVETASVMLVVASFVDQVDLVSLTSWQVGLDPRQNFRYPDSLKLLQLLLLPCLPWLRRLESNDSDVAGSPLLIVVVVK